jgi:thioester reductase-like protein
VARVVANYLKVDRNTIDPQMPLTLYGLDSVGSMELVAALEIAFGRELPEWLLLEHPDLEALSQALEDVRLKPDATSFDRKPDATSAFDSGDSRRPDASSTVGVASGDNKPDASTVGVASGFSRTSLDQMLADSLLPPDIRPPNGSAAATERRVLLTGATGFLGAHLLRELLEETPVEVWCLVRGPESDVHQRVAQNLARYGINPCTNRIHTVGADLTRPNLGLTVVDHQHLCESIDAIYHAAADVNWVLPYNALRHANVIATRELLRLACTLRPKVFHFISSLSVCYVSGGPAVIDEGDEMLPHVDRLALGYAQSKCVAESLVRHAAARGLPVRIHRPSLIVGDSQSGISNLDDLVALLVKGCIQMGAAPDLDWTFDAMPVDYVSRAIVRLGQKPHLCQTWHLHHPRPRHWRECVLWMNVFGYQVRLVPYSEWEQLLAIEALSPQHALHRLRPFFLRPSVTDGEDSSDAAKCAVPELYQEGRRSVVRGELSRQAAAAAGLDAPRLDAELFDRYFASYISRGFLPLPTRPVSLPRPTQRVLACYEDPRFLERLLRRYSGDSFLCVRNVSLDPMGGDHGIISELTSWRRGCSSGLFRCQLTIERSGATRTDHVDMIIKAKPSARDALDIGQTVAAMCDERLAQAFSRYRDRIGLTGSHLRELAIYELSDDRLQPYLPRCFGTWRDDAREEWGLALENLQSLTLMNAVDPEAWLPAHIDAALLGMSDIHAVWYGREQELHSAKWLGEPLSRQRARDLTTLWHALAEHAAPCFASWAGPSIVDVHRQLIDSTNEWWQALEEQPRTLIHNDFSPRNVALRQDGTGFRLCAYDWELATLGPAQRDLAEFLCFVLTPDVDLHTAGSLVERYRHLLQRGTGASVSRDLWREGFRGALADLLIDKLSFYALVNRVRSQPYLPRVLKTWQRLYELFSTKLSV